MEQTVERFGTDLVRKQSIKTIDSREVAEMLGKEHSELLKEIEGRKDKKNVGIIPVLEKGKFHLSNYFIPDTYKSGTREYKCYQITKMGCELIGNKQQGEKGILFTAKYVERFNEMEEVIKQPKTAFDLLELQFKAIKETKDQLNQVNFKTLQTRKELEDFKEDIPLFNVECDELQALVKKKGVSVLGGKGSMAYKDKSLRTKVYVDIQQQIKREFGLNSYKAIKRGQLEIAKKIVNEYKAPIVLNDEINCLNNQLAFK